MYSKTDIEREILLMIAFSNSMKNGRSMFLYRDIEEYYNKGRRRKMSAMEDIMFI
jgi:hypothetical protein